MATDLGNTWATNIEIKKEIRQQPKEIKSANSAVNTDSLPKKEV